MFTEILRHIRAKKPAAGVDAYVAEPNHWVIGPYDSLTHLTQDLRSDTPLRRKFARCGARIGRREGDVPPVGEKTVTSFRSAIEGKDPKVSNIELARQFAGQRHGAGANPFVPRFTDQFDEVAEFYADKTLEAHHIVEKSILGTLKVNIGELANERAPCVLIVAELHQRLFTREVASARSLFAPTMTGELAWERLKGIYDVLYLEPIMSELRAIAAIIGLEVRIRKQGK